MNWSYIRPGLVILAALLAVGGMSISTFVAITSNEKSAWQAVKPTKEAEKIITGHLNLGEFLSWQQAIDSATYRQISDRYRVYRFISPQTCGNWGCLHVIADKHLQQTKAYHLKVAESPQDESNLVIDQKGCVSAIQANSQGIVERYPLCLNPT
jgi:hypothetical protein